MTTELTENTANTATTADTTNAAYEKLADTRPRIGRDVLFTQTSEGVLFHNAHGGFHLAAKSAYRFASLIVPHLNGRHRVGDLCAGLPEDRRTMVTDLVGTLYERGFARPVPAEEETAGVAGALPAEVTEEFAPQINYIDHFEDGAAERFARFRTSRVAVLGDGPVARWCALSIVRNGGANVDVAPAATENDDTTQAGGLGAVRAEARRLAERGAPAELGMLPHSEEPLGWADLGAYDVVVCTGPDAPRQIHRLLTEGIPAGRSVLPLTVLGDRAVAGPSMTAGRPGCWACAMLRLAANEEGTTAAADVWSRVSLPGARASDAALGQNPAAQLGNLLGYEVFRMTAQAPPAETEGRIIVQELDSMDTLTERVLPHPDCSFCREADGRPAAPAVAGTLPEAPHVATAPTADDAEAVLEQLNAESELVGAAAGVFTRFADDDLTQTPLKAGRLVLGTGGGRRRTVAAFDVHHAAGARLRALRTAVDVYVEHAVPLPGVLRGTALADARAVLPTVTPASLSTASGLPVTADSVEEWVAATSLSCGERALVPAAAVRTFGAHNASRAYVPTSAGAGAGGSLPEALHHALMSALAYDALEATARGTRNVTEVPLTALEDDAELRFLVRSAANLETGIELLDLGESEAAGSGAYVLLARAAGGRWAIGADLTWQGAAMAALRDLAGRVQLTREDPEGAAPDTGDALLAAFEPAAVAVSGTAAPDLTAATTAEAVLDRLRSAGRDVLVVQTASDDLLLGGMHAVRALLTGRKTA
ncbi:TOMM precursor leader peptide-binding protein [Streptomyces sp. NPDC057654]|uniref:TOMM precursor leader peptide-binding protein n=1 Tax=Streptomyces sp. NPDC057654 TaxID=3346196 RepID=UPI0036A55FC9